MTGLQHTLSCDLRGQKDDLNAHWKIMTHKNSRTIQIYNIFQQPTRNMVQFELDACSNISNYTICVWCLNYS